MDASAVFPNSVNAAPTTIIKDKLHRIERLDQISRHTSETVQATTRYSETLYWYKHGELLSTTVKIRYQILDVFA